MSIVERAHRNVNVTEFASTGVPEMLGRIDLTCPEARQYILRMPVRVDGGEYVIPDELAWLGEMFTSALAHQRSFGSDHPFCYITVRHGLVDSQTDDVWHVDGFSTKVAHAPEQNYIWCSRIGTEYTPLSVEFPDDFDPRTHNVNEFLGRFVSPSDISNCEESTMYCMDPYILHRRPLDTTGVMRTFVRISFVAIEIDDVNNTQNPNLPRQYSNDGVKFRNTLSNYA